jgi:hypothetical protein
VLSRPRRNHQARIAVNACENEKTKIDAIVDELTIPFPKSRRKPSKSRTGKVKTERNDILNHFNGNEDLVQKGTGRSHARKTSQMTAERSEVGAN